MEPARIYICRRRGAELDDVVERLKRKDGAGLRILMNQYGDRLLRTAYLLLRDRQAAEEAVQDTFVQAFYKIEQLDDPAKLKAWLIRIAVNHCRMKQRTRSWRSILPSLHVERMGEESASGAEEHFFEQWDKERLSEAMLRVEYKYREIMILYYYNDLNVSEIAEQLSMKENTVKSRLMRGRERLKMILRGRGIEDDLRA